MSGMDSFIDGARRCIDSAAEKTGDFIEVSKLKLEKTQLESKVREQYQKLGKMCFDMSETGTDTTPYMNEVMDKIRELKKDIQWTEDRINSVKPQKTCASCGKKNSTENLYCQNCGAKL
ncbi:MAG: hypothetical protein E7507_08450 [Ruminococcus sp.]|nr:hypothetical protein [Ruminococcus sp.]